MTELVNLLASYFNVRAAILRTLADQSPAPAQLMDALRLSRDALNRRRKNPEHWPADELSKLAEFLHLRLTPDRYTRAITMCVQAMDENEQQQLLREIHITPSRLKTICKNSNCWRYAELVQISQWVNRACIR